jgi:hypothetical protein
MLRKNFEDVFIVDWHNSTIRKIQAEHVDYTWRVVLDEESGGGRVVGHYHVLMYPVSINPNFPGETKAKNSTQVKGNLEDINLRISSVERLHLRLKTHPTHTIQ